MSVVKRLSNITSATVNHWIDLVEDPDIMVDHTMRILNSDVDKVKHETAAVMAEEKRAKRAVDSCRSQIEKYASAAKNAIKEGNDEDARILIQQKQQHEQILESLEETHRAAVANSSQIKNEYERLSNDVQQLETRRATIHGKCAVSKARSHMNKVISSVDSGASIESFERYEQKADQNLDIANAESELGEFFTTPDDIMKKYGGGSTISVEEELDSLKKELGIA